MNGKGKVGRPRTYATARALRQGIESYFATVAYERDVVVYRQEIGEKDGEPVLKQIPEFLTDGNGQRVKERIWLREPSVEELCVHLGISDTTWGNYMDDEELGPVAHAAKDMIRARLVELLNTRNSTRGIEFNLENNFDYKRKLDVGGTGKITVEMEDRLKELAE